MSEEQWRFRRRWWGKIEGSNSNVKPMFRRDPCSFCRDGRGGTLDHIKPRHIVSGIARGNYNNMTGACPKCNFDKGSGHFLMYFAEMQGSPLIGYQHSPKA